MMKKYLGLFFFSLSHYLDELHDSNPKGYMNFVKSLRDGSFDKKVNNNTSHVNPDKWREHFSSLLGPQVELNQSDQDLINFVEQNCDKFESKLSDPFHSIVNPTFRRFDALLSHSKYPTTQWKMSFWDQSTNHGTKVTLVILEGLLYHHVQEKCLINYYKKKAWKNVQK